MYWSDWDEGGTIERAGMDGSMQMTFLNKIGRAKGLTIDYVERKIYWTLFLQSSGAIESCDLNGNKRVTLVSNDIERPFALTLYKVRFFFIIIFFYLFNNSFRISLRYQILSKVRLLHVSS